MKLRPYQHRAVQHMLDTPRCALWAGMGLGKTISTLTALSALSLVDEGIPTLVLAPLRVASSVWPYEIAKWGLQNILCVSTILGSKIERCAALRRDANIFTCNYDNLQWLCEYLGDDWPFRTVVADESTRLKSFRLRQGGKRAQALSKVAHRKVERWVNLTGTPAPNGLKDLWGQMWFVDQGQRLGRTFSAFSQRWFRPTYDGYDIEPLPHAQAEIQELLKDVCLTLDPKDYFDLKDPIINNIYVDLPVQAMKLYKDMEKKMFIELEGSSVEAFNAASMTIKCLQIANGAVYTDESGNFKKVHDEKIKALESVIEEASGVPILVTYHFKSDLARLREAFPKGRTLDASIGTIQDWNAGHIPILFAHPASAGHGLNLQSGGNIIVFFGHWWNLEEYQQIIERIGPVRQMQAGHDRPVFIHHILARNTIDEVVMQRRETKREVQDLLLGAMKK